MEPDNLAVRYAGYFKCRLAADPVTWFEFEKDILVERTLCFKHELLGIWKEETPQESLPAVLKDKRPKPWTILMCGKNIKGAEIDADQANRSTGVLNAVLWDLDLWPYKEFLTLDATGWSDDPPPAKPDREKYIEWIMKGLQPQSMRIAVEHENEGFAFVDHVRYPHLREKKTQSVGSIEYSATKLSHVRPNLRVLVAYPAVACSCALDLDKLDETDDEAGKYLKERIGGFPQSKPGDQWLLIFGYIVKTQSGGEDIAWRYQNLSITEMKKVESYRL